jgi:ribose transport system permease protein
MGAVEVGTGGRLVPDRPLADLRYRYPPRYLVAWIGLATVALIIVIFAPSTYSGVSMRLVTALTAVLVVAGLGQMLVIMLGAIDLSVPAQMTLGAGLMVSVGAHNGVVLSVVAALVACAVVSAVNGALISLLRLNSLIVTLATNGIVAGIMLLKFGQKFSTTGQAPQALQTVANAKIGPINDIFLLAVVVAVLMAFYLNRTRAGKRVAAVGANRSAARALGIGVHRVDIGTFVLAGVLYGIAGVLLGAWIGIPNTSLGDNYDLSSITTVAIGGAALTGGPASVSAIAAGGFLLSLLGQALQIRNLGAGVGLLVQGLILVLALSILMLGVRGREIMTRATKTFGSLRHDD